MALWMVVFNATKTERAVSCLSSVSCRQWKLYANWQSVFISQLKHQDQMNHTHRLQSKSQGGSDHHWNIPTFQSFYKYISHYICGWNRWRTLVFHLIAFKISDSITIAPKVHDKWWKWSKQPNSSVLFILLIQLEDCQYLTILFKCFLVISQMSRCRSPA